MGYSVGAKDIKRFFSILRISAISVFIIVTSINLLLVFNSSIMVQIFTDSESIKELIRIPALIYGLSAPFIFTTNVILFALQPVGMEKVSTVIFALQQIVLFIPLLFILRNYGFVYALSAQPGAEVIGGIVTLCLAPLVYKEDKNLFSK